MQVARPQAASYFRDARALVARLHRRGVAHNDLAKEPNWLVTPDGEPAIVELRGQVIPVEGLDACVDSHPHATHDRTRV